MSHIGGDAMESDPGFTYCKFMKAIEAIAQGKDPSGSVSADGGRLFRIPQILLEARTLDGDFPGDHIDVVKAAFVRLGIPYPGASIAKCVVVLQAALYPSSAPPQ